MWRLFFHHLYRLKCPLRYLGFPFIPYPPRGVSRKRRETIPEYYNAEQNTEDNNGTPSASIAPADHNKALIETDLLSSLGTSIWRMRRRLAQDGVKEHARELRQLDSYAQSAWDALANSGVEIQDHTGSPFNSGMALKVLAFQPMQDVVQEKIMETIKPSIYYQKQLIQMGEVIVAVPQNDALQSDQKRQPDDAEQ